MPGSIKILRFKEEVGDRLIREFYQEIDTRLQTIIYALAGFLMAEWELNIVITHLVRTQTEQDDIYNSHTIPAVRLNYKDNPWLSVHQFGRGADMRVHWRKKMFGTRDLTRSEQEGVANSINNFLNGRFEYDFGRLKTSIRHDVGRGDHIHIQVDNNDVTRMIK